MRLLSFLLFLLLVCASSSAEDIRISLKSADGRTAYFSGILAIDEDGVLVSRGMNPEPFLLRWELLDQPDLERQFPSILEQRGTGNIFPRGIYAPENQRQYPRAALYRILHSPRQVAPPDFNDFFSDPPPHIDPANIRPTNSPHSSLANWVSRFYTAQWCYERMLERLFPHADFTFQSTWTMPKDPADRQAPKFYVEEKDDETIWQLPPFLALKTLATPEMRTGVQRSGPHVELQFTRWVADYLRRETIFQSLLLELAPLIDAADHSEKPEFRRFHDVLSTLRRNGAVDPQATDELRRLLTRYQLP